MIIAWNGGQSVTALPFAALLAALHLRRAYAGAKSDGHLIRWTSQMDIIASPSGAASAGSCDELSGTAYWAQLMSCPRRFGWAFGDGSCRFQTTSRLYGPRHALDRQDDDQGPDETDCRSGTIAPVGVRRDTKHAGRFCASDIVAADVRADAKELGGAAGDPAARHAFRVPGRDARLYRGLGRDNDRSLGRNNDRSLGPARPIITRPSCGLSRRQEREPAPSAARRANERGGSPTRKTVALSRWAMHAGRPALSGRSDEAVRNSCV